MKASDSYQKFTVLDEEIEVYLKITKLDTETGKPVLLPNTAFQIYWLDDNGNYRLENWKPKLVTMTDTVNGHLTKNVDTFYTNEEGILTLPEKLPLGKYRIVETVGPDGFYNEWADSGNYYVDFDISTDRIYKATGDDNENGMDTLVIGEDYLSEAAQISAYLTAPAGFSQHCIVYLQNLYSGTVYALDVYESNQLAAVCTEADSGLYALLSARVAGDATERYQFECEQKELNTDDGASFHLTVTDMKNPDAELCTPSRDENATVQRAAAYNAPATAAPSETPTPEPTSSQPVQQNKKPANPFWNVLDFLPIVFIGAGLFWFRQKNRRGGPKG